MKIISDNFELYLLQTKISLISIFSEQKKLEEKNPPSQPGEIPPIKEPPLPKPQPPIKEPPMLFSIHAKRFMESLNHYQKYLNMFKPFKKMIIGEKNGYLHRLS